MAKTPEPDAKAQNSKGDWKSLHLWQIQGVRDVLVFLAVLGLLWLGQKISVVTVPLLLAVLFAYLFEPVIVWVMRKAGWDRQRSVTAVMAAAILIVVVPSAVGLAFGVAQSIGLLKNLSDRITVTYDAVEAGRELDRELAAWMGDDWDGRTLDNEDFATLKETLTEPPGAPQDADASDEANGRGDPSPDRPESGDGAERDGAADARVDEGEGGAARAIGPPVESSTQQEAGARDRVRSRLSYYERALHETGEPGTFYRDIAELIYDTGANNTVDEVFGTVQRWLRANAEQVATAGAGALATTLKLLSGAFGLVFMVFITAFFFYFIATGWVGVQRFGAGLIPDRHRELTLDLLAKFDAVINAFIRGRLTIAFLQAVVFTVGYFVIGVPAAFTLGPVVAVLSIVPYLALVGVPISIALLATAGYDGFRGEWWWYLGAPTVFYFIGQALDDYLWTPRIQGKGTDMSTPMILFASLAGGVLFGVFGLLIAIPIAACLKILIQEVFWPRFKAWAEGREKDFLPISRD